MQLLIGNDQVIVLYGVRDIMDGVYLYGAAVTMTLKKLDGIPVEGQTWPSALMDWDAVADPMPGVDLPIPFPSSGNYKGVLESTLELVNGKYYTLEISIDAGSGLIASYRYKLQAVFRVVTT